MPSGEVIARYHDLLRAEQSFRMSMSKNDLRGARPMSHHQGRVQAPSPSCAPPDCGSLPPGRDRHENHKIARTLQPLQRIAGHDPLAQNPFTDTARRILNDLGNPAQ